MKLTVDSLKNLTGIEILDEDEVLNDWKNVEIENPVVKRDGKYTEISFTVVKKMAPYNSYLFGGQILTLTLEDNKIYDFFSIIAGIYCSIYSGRATYFLFFSNFSASFSVRFFNCISFNPLLVMDT